MKKIAVLYHTNCHDGFSAAWAAWKKFGNKASYIPVEPQTLPKEKIKNSEVYVIDASYHETAIQELLKNNNFVTVIDHHVSHRKDAEIASQWHFDLNHSGAVLAWQYFHPDKKIPRLLLHIEDLDLWKFKLPHSQEVDVILEFVKLDFRSWDKTVRNFESIRFRKIKFKEAVSMIRYKKMLIEKILRRAETARFAGYRASVVNSPVFQSEIGHLLVNKSQPIAVIWFFKKEKFKVSLRSNGKVDVAKIAKKYGGGGHKLAAGFSWPLNKKLPWQVIKQ